MSFSKFIPTSNWMKAELFSRPIGRIFQISTTPRRLLFGGLFTLLAILLVTWRTPMFFAPDVAQGALLYALCYGLCILLGVLTCLCWRVPNACVATWLHLISAALLPLVSMTMVETLNGVSPLNWSLYILCINYITYWVFYAAIYAICGTFRWPMVIANSLFFLLSMTNYYVMLFRGSPFLPMDFMATGTAMEVAAGYDFSISHLQVIAILLFAFILIISCRLNTLDLPRILKIVSRILFGALSTCAVCLYFFTNITSDTGLNPNFYNQAQGYRSLGVVPSFCLNIKYATVAEPDNYNADEIPAILTSTLNGDTVDELGLIPAVDAPAKTPNIICIMNESLTDLSILGDVQTNTPYFPYLNSLTEDTVRGNLAVSVIGGGTSNSEFEFLTGTPMTYLPSGSNVYTLYINKAKETLVSALETQGYSSTAFHPYYSAGWNRVPVYNHFGFDRTYFIEDLLPAHVLHHEADDATIMQQMVESVYPNQQVLLRQYVSDHYDYKKLIEQYEARDPNKPFFMFNVTMQNHGGYNAPANVFNGAVEVTGLPNGITYPKANQFLSLMKYSDEAIAELIAYFEQQEEPTVICIFGDHQPVVEEDYVKSLLGVNDLYSMSTEQTQKRYTTPFVIWANYDIPEQEIPLLSANYLSSYVMKVAGMTETEMPLYNQYLLKLSETLPVISGICVMDNTGTYYEPDSNPYTDLLADYEKVVYNHLFDEEKCHRDLYNKP